MLPQALLKQYLDSANTENKLELLETFDSQVEFVAEIRDLYRTSFLTFVRELSQSDPSNEIQIETALDNAFLRLDSDFSNEALIDLSRKDAAKTLAVAMSGAVAVVAHFCGPHLHVAGCGDCQAVLGVLSGI